MNLIDWLLFTIIVSRRLTNAYYIIMVIISVIAILIAYKMRFKRFSLYLWLISGLLCLCWESYLYGTGARHYNFVPALELLYHALTEAGPGLIIMILFAHKIKLIDICEYRDDYKGDLDAHSGKSKPEPDQKTELENADEEE